MNIEVSEITIVYLNAMKEYYISNTNKEVDEKEFLEFLIKECFTATSYHVFWNKGNDL